VLVLQGAMDQQLLDVLEGRGLQDFMCDKVRVILRMMMMMVMSLMMMMMMMMVVMMVMMMTVMEVVLLLLLLLLMMMMMYDDLVVWWQIVFGQADPALSTPIEKEFYELLKVGTDGCRYFGPE
jgi:hypothetical protein